MSMEGLRQGAQSVRNQSSGRGSSRNAFYARWRPPQMLDVLRPILAAPPDQEAITEMAEPIVVIPGDYTDHYAKDPNGVLLNTEIEAYRYRAHNFQVWMPPRNPRERGFNSYREIICSTGPEPHAPQPCVGCYQVDHGAKDSKPRDRWVFNIAHLAWYHNHPLMKDGQIQTKRNTNEPLMVKDECQAWKKENQILYRASQRRIADIRQPKGCEGCEGQHPFVWGDHRVLEVGSKHLMNLLNENSELKKKCANCGTYIMRVGFRCGNERCDQRLWDIATSMRGWTNDQIEEFAKTPQQCQFCNYHGLLYVELVCGLDQNYQPIPGAGCGENEEPRELSIFDLVLWVQRQGKDTDSEIVVKKSESFRNFKTPDNRPLEDYLKEIVKAPFDLVEMYKPETLDAQAERVRVPNPYAQPQQQYQQYGSPGGYQQAPQAGGYPPQPNYSPPGQPMLPGNYNPPQQQQPNPGAPPGRPNYNK